MNRVAVVLMTNSLATIKSAFQFNISATDTLIVMIVVMRIPTCVEVGKGYGNLNPLHCYFNFDSKALVFQ